MTHRCFRHGHIHKYTYIYNYIYISIFICIHTHIHRPTHLNVNIHVNQGWATGGPRAGSGPRGPFNRPLACLYISTVPGTLGTFYPALAWEPLIRPYTNEFLYIDRH